jgi:branched-chain amino acid transport system permease protein
MLIGLAGGAHQAWSATLFTTVSDVFPKQAVASIVGLGGFAGSIAGMMIAPIVFLEPNMMSGVLLYAFAAALVGGIDSPGGAVLGGFLVGILENLLGAYVIGTELKLSVALVLIVTVLTIRPAGLFGKVIVTRV